LTTLASDTAYHSFAGEVEAQTPPRYAAFFRSARHQLLRIARSADSLNQTGQQVVRRNLNIQPTITIRPGFPVRVIVNRDLVLAPYQG